MQQREYRPIIRIVRMDITVIGAGYVGLITATCFAEVGHYVICAEKVKEKVKKLNAGEPVIYEPGLKEIMRKNLDKGRLRFTSNVVEAIKSTDLIFVCVGTPQREDGKADLSQVEEVARLVAENLKGYKLVVEKSTVPVKTAWWIKRTIRLYSRKNPAEFDIASNPEFLKEGSAIQDFMHPDRIVIGVENKRAKEILLKLYKDFNCPILVTDVNTAELIKHAANAFLATKISFINMVADLCEKTGADIELVAKGMGMDVRIGPHFLKAGIGYGGSCFPKDVKAFIKIAEEYQVDFGLLREVDKINLSRCNKFMEKIYQALWIPRDKLIGVLGLAFKPNTDDIREAPSIKIIKWLYEEGAYLKLYDPQAMDNMKAIYVANERLQYVNSPYEAAKGAHALLILTEWEEFKQLDLKEIKQKMETPIIVDGRNIYDPTNMKNLGFEYFCIGR